MEKLKFPVQKHFFPSSSVNKHKLPPQNVYIAPISHLFHPRTTGSGQLIHLAELSELIYGAARFILSLRGKFRGWGKPNVHFSRASPRNRRADISATGRRAQARIRALFIFRLLFYLSLSFSSLTLCRPCAS